MNLLHNLTQIYIFVNVFLCLSKFTIRNLFRLNKFSSIRVTYWNLHLFEFRQIYIREFFNRQPKSSSLDINTQQMLWLWFAGNTVTLAKHLCVSFWWTIRLLKISNKKVLPCDRLFTDKTSKNVLQILELQNIQQSNTSINIQQSFSFNKTFRLINGDKNRHSILVIHLLK